MDGTLLDKYFDDYFWEHLVPEKYSEKHDITFGKAKELLSAKYKAHEGTLNWTDIDFWSKELKLDIPALKEQIKHMIEVHPHVKDFLIQLKMNNKKVFMVTNAHYKVLEIKLRETSIGEYFDKCITSFEMGHPKEQQEFWHKAQTLINFEKERTMFIDDTVNVLRAAKQYGIKNLFLKNRPNSKREPLVHSEFQTVDDFNELCKMISDQHKL
ncbi:MAG: HAD-IA family hydrolase [Nitrospirae bacterium]|nr:HAD-IA family hydrolase [Nitrospirota bacterium]